MKRQTPILNTLREREGRINYYSIVKVFVLQSINTRTGETSHIIMCGSPKQSNSFLLLLLLKLSRQLSANCSHNDNFGDAHIFRLFHNIFFVLLFKLTISSHFSILTEIDIEWISNEMLMFFFCYSCVKILILICWIGRMWNSFYVCFIFLDKY